MKPDWQSPEVELWCGDALEKLRCMESESVQCCVTSPPYWGLRDYGVKGQLGLEKTPEEYVAKLVAIFAEVRRALKKDGVAWVNLGDSYFGGGRSGNPEESLFRKQATNAGSLIAPTKVPEGCKPKDLVGIPWMVAFALRSDGWFLRQDIIWSKPNPMPESVTDRCTKAHEYIFLLSKSANYFYNQDAIREPHTSGENTVEGIAARDAIGDPNGKRNGTKSMNDGKDRTKPPSRPPGYIGHEMGRNRRSVWTVGIAAYAEAHFATFPPDLIRPCILAGSRQGDIVLDPFGGSGTVGMVAVEYGRKARLIEINPEYGELIKSRCDVTPSLPFHVTLEPKPEQIPLFG